MPDDFVKPKKFVLPDEVATAAATARVKTYKRQPMLQRAEVRRRCRLTSG